MAIPRFIMDLLQSRKEESDLEERVMNKINSFYLVERKSSEVFSRDGIPITTTKEIEYILDMILRNKDEGLTTENQTAQWDKFWLQEEIASMMLSFKYDHPGDYLPGRNLHYESLAYQINSLFEREKLMNLKQERGIKEILEIGCGNGVSLSVMSMIDRGKSKNVTGLDSSIMALHFAKYLAHRYGISDKVNLVHGDYFNTPFKNDKFDVVYNSGVFEHLEFKQASELLGEMMRVAKPGGYILIDIPNEKSPFYRRYKQRENNNKENFQDLNRIPVEHLRYSTDIRKLMENEGLHVLKEDGLQISPSAPVKKGDIFKEDLHFFDTYLSERDSPPSTFVKSTIWFALEVMQTNSNFRRHYGWSTFYVGQKK